MEPGGEYAHQRRKNGVDRADEAGCMMKYVQMGVIKYSTPHAAVRMRFVLMKIGLCNAASPL